MIMKIPKLQIAAWLVAVTLLSAASIMNSIAIIKLRATVLQESKVEELVPLLNEQVEARDQ